MDDSVVPLVVIAAPMASVSGTSGHDQGVPPETAISKVGKDAILRSSIVYEHDRL